MRAPVGVLKMMRNSKAVCVVANSILALRKQHIHPNQFDIMVMANIFGDIISYLACTARLNLASTICIAQILYTIINAFLFI